jgi:hypothetical protein
VYPEVRRAADAAAARLGRSGVLLVAAACCAVLALALPWSSSTDATYIPGWFVPSMCTTVYDSDGWPSMDCTASMMSPGIFLPGVGAYGGKDSEIRVFLVAVVALVVLARRRRRPSFATAAVVLAGAGLALAGLRPRSGQIAYLAGMVLLVIALRTDGLLGRRQHPAPAPPDRAGHHERASTAQAPAGTTSPTT